MRFEVPQFIDVEDKIFGQLTFKQFVYLVGGAALAYVSFKLIPTPFWVPVSLIAIALGLALAFYKLNNRPFLEVAQSWLAYEFKNKLYIWKRSPPVDSKPVAAPKPVPKAPEKIFTAESVDTLAHNLDIMDT
jgi:PrgI family protein